MVAPRRSDEVAARDARRAELLRTRVATTAARALLEIAPQLSDRRLKRAVRQAQAERATNVRQIAGVLRRAGGHRGTMRLAEIIATGPAPTASGHEDAILEPARLVRRLRAAGAPYTDAQP